MHSAKGCCCLKGSCSQGEKKDSRKEAFATLLTSEAYLHSAVVLARTLKVTGSLLDRALIAILVEGQTDGLSTNFLVEEG
eukprot:4277321-Amphidinium_carterae.2